MKQLLYFFSFLTLITNLISCTKQHVEHRKTETPVVVSKPTEVPKTNIQESSLEQQLKKEGLVDVCKLDSSIRFDLRYASKNNFTKVVLYDTLRSVYLQLEVARKLLKAQKLLKKKDVSLTLLIWDAARPMSVQRKMYAQVAGTRLHRYVAAPSRTGLHNYGCAVDLTICQATNDSLLDMGTCFDYFGRRASIRHEETFLTKKQLENRRLLRSVMQEAGFRAIKGEWWHFNAFSLPEAKRRYKVLE